MTPKRVIGDLFNCMTQLFPSNRLWLCEVKKWIVNKKFGTYPKSADPKITTKETSSYPIRYMAQILPDVTTDIAGHKNSSADRKILELTLVQLTFKQWLTPSSSCIWFKYCQEIDWGYVEYERKYLTKITRTYPESTETVVT